jgi:hypothetical protein
VGYRRCDQYYQRSHKNYRQFNRYHYLYCNSAAESGTITVYPAFTAGAITTAFGITAPGTNPNITIANETPASGGDGNISYQWRRSGTSSATLSYNAATYPVGNDASNYAAAGTYDFTRYAHDATCNTSWNPSSGQYTLTVQTPNYPPGAGTNTYTCGTQVWSEPVRVADCDKESFTASNTAPDCRSYTYNGIRYYYYNWVYVNNNKTTMCPSPWRVPSPTDFDTVMNCLGTSTITGVYYPESSVWGGALAGNCWYSYPSNVGVGASYWSDTAGRFWGFTSSYVAHSTTSNQNGFLVRCVK